jgi:hypothetical protein
MTTLNLNNINDDLIELNRDTFNSKQMGFNIPNRQQRVNQNNFMNDDVLFNKNKISSDVISMSSRSSSRSSSRASSVNGDYDKSAYMKNMKNIYKGKGSPKISKYKEESDESSVVSSSSNRKAGSGNGSHHSHNQNSSHSSNKYKAAHSKYNDRDEDDDDEGEEEDDDGEDDDDDGEDGEIYGDDEVEYGDESTDTMKEPSTAEINTNSAEEQPKGFKVLSFEDFISNK